MFDKTSALYDLFYEKGLGKDYAAEAESIAALLPATTRSLLDVACGTGLHLEHLSKRFECAGIDIEPGMLDVARARCPGIELVEADMVDFDLGRTFDAVICMFSSIGYVATEERLQRAVASMAAHLNPAGILVVEPWFQPEMWSVGYPHVLVVDEPEVKACRMSVSGRDGEVAIVDFQYLVATPDGIEHLEESHRLTLFTWDQYRDAFERAGLAATVEREGGLMGRGLVTGRKR
jgi:SAM-dependent methyltransferase